MIYDEIIAIKKIQQGKTVDITVDGDNLFWCNDILTHNSGAGDQTEITEENIQGGISKIQAADNVVALIPNSQNREAGMIRMKLLKTRDSGGVGKYIDFHIDWSTLSFNPWDIENETELSGTRTPNISIPKIGDQKSSGMLIKTDRGKKKKKIEEDTENMDENTSGKKLKNTIHSLKKKSSMNKNVKLC